MNKSKGRRKRHPGDLTSTTADILVSRQLGQTLIVFLDGYENPSVVRPLITDYGVGTVVITCEAAPGQKRLQKFHTQAILAEIRLQT